MELSAQQKQLLSQQAYYERLIKRGQAGLEDYEAYVRCQRALLLPKDSEASSQVDKGVQRSFLTGF